MSKKSLPSPPLPQHSTASFAKHEGLALLQRTMERHVDLSASERALLARYEQDPISTQKKALLWRAGTQVGELFILQSGWATTTRLSRDGEQQVIELMLPGDIIGLSEFTFAKHLSEASMITRGSIQSFPHENIVDIIEASTPITIALFANISRHQALITERMLNAFHRSARSQVLHFIIETFFRLDKIHHVELASFAFPVSQRLLASILGLTPVHINRIFKALEQDGLLKKFRDRIEVYDAKRVMEEAEFDTDYLAADMDGMKERLAMLSPSDGSS